MALEIRNIARTDLDQWGLVNKMINAVLPTSEEGPDEKRWRWFAAYIHDKETAILAYSQRLGYEQAFAVYSPFGRCPLCEVIPTEGLRQHICSHLIGSSTTLKSNSIRIDILPSNLPLWGSNRKNPEIYLPKDIHHFLRRIG